MKPLHVWTLFALCLVALLAAMGWSSAIVLRLERSQASAQAQAALEENARLALWRMDSTVGSLVAQENARPYFQYRAFYSASSPYTNMFADPSPSAPLLPSPLLLETPAHIVLHFQIEPGGTVTSPQVPSGPLRSHALTLGHTTPALLTSRATRLDEVRASVRQTSFSGELLKAEVATPRPNLLSRLLTESAPQQKLKSAREYEMRQQSYEALNKNTTSNVWQFEQNAAVATVATPVEEGTLAPLWTGDVLLLVRRVRVGGASYQQGCWVDWPRLQRDLLASVQDLLPNARLERAAASHGPAPDEERRLAALPVRLVPGAVAVPPSSISAVRVSLTGAWAFLLLAALAVAVLLRGVMTLSERRRVFVSAVTHELRTPLTTFRLYSDMLAEGMVSGEEKRQEYLGRLRMEAQRLGHLVENVLFYARLDSGRAGAVREMVDLADVLRQTVTGLEERTRKAGLAIVFDDQAGGLRARVDRSALEQIVVNLVDNACKYAVGSTPPEIRIELARDDRRALVRVRDHGPGLSAAERRRLFRPFSKSDREAANSAPGVGLGLALSRQLARALGGDLSLEQTGAPGASFLLALPL